MPYMNHVVLLGHMGQDPELRTTKNGSHVLNVSLATTRKYKSGDEWKDETTWHNVVIFGKVAEWIAEQGRKGDSLLVDGYIRTRKWQDKGGNDRLTVEVVADHATTFPKRQGTGSSGGQQRREPERRNEAQYDDDTPF